MVPWFLSVFLLFLLSFKAASGCLQCDRRFLDSAATVMKETLPGDVPDREMLIERHVEALSNIHGTYLRQKYERVLDVRGVKAIKSDIISRLREIKAGTWKGVFLWQLSLYEIRTSLRQRMQRMLEKFADLACSEDCTVTEGPILDCWTCLRILAQCYDGELCGVEDKRLAEYNEVVLYVFLVCESVVLTSTLLIYMVCIKHTRTSLQKALAR
ncbi:izumo sperm-egg fusion protein 3 [Anolis carolinensis]|uniref:izumo sperm-egg fusion protein 3 n=1 Tax=Anolis carolinensis TaxID=28377 RepID=UPI000203A443